MANPRDVNIDIVGHDHTEAAFKRVEKNIKSLGNQMGTATRTMAKAGAMVASFSSLLGPAAIGAAKVASATAKMGATMAPLVAFAPAIVGGLLFLKQTLVGIAPVMGQALLPVATAFTRAQEAAGKLAAQGLPRLAAAFNKVNMPTIALGMDSVARSANKSALTFGRWVNSAAGVQLIGDVTDGMSRAFAKVAPAVTRAAIALLNMTNRAGVADRLSKLGGIVARLADRFTAWANSVTSGDITGALNAVKDAAGALGGKLALVKDAIVWIGENPAKIKAMSDALAGVGIALGLVSGGWVAVIAGAVTLIANHWDLLKPKFQAAATWANDAWNRIANDPNIQRIGAALATIGRAIKDDFIAAWDLLKPKFDAVGRAAQDLWAKMGPFVAQVLENPDVRNGLRIIAMGLAAVAVAMLVLTAVTAGVAAAVIGSLAAMAAYFAGIWVRAVLAAVSMALGAFGAFATGLGGVIKHIPGLGGVGRALEDAGNWATRASGQVRDLARSLDQVRSKTVTVTVHAVGNGVNLIQRSNSDIVAYQNKGGSQVKARAAGGPVQAGVPYWVGERGRELITPSRNGYVWPAGTGPASGGGGVTVVNNVYITQPLGDAQSIAAAVQNAFSSAVAGGMSLRPMAQAIARAA